MAGPNSEQKAIGEHLAIMGAWLEIKTATDKIGDPTLEERILKAAKKIVDITMRMSSRTQVAETVLTGGYDKIVNAIENAEVDKALARRGMTTRDLEDKLPKSMDDVLDLLNRIK